MSKSTTELKLSDSDAWMLRIDDGTEFGPVDNETMIAWAQQGRISPGNQVSRGDGHWFAAEELDELEMIWMVELSDGSDFGPVNLRALEDLLNNGAVLPGATLVNRRTGESTSPRSRHNEIFFGSSMELNENLAWTEDTAGIAQKQTEALNAHLAEFEASLDQTASLLNDHRQDLAGKRATQARLQSLLQARDAAVDKLEAEAAATKKQYPELKAQTDRANEEARTRQKKLANERDALKQQLHDLQAAVSTANSQAQQLQSTLNTLKKDQERLQSQHARAVADLEAARRELTAEREAHAADRKARKALQIRHAEHEKQNETARREIDKLRGDLRATQEKALDAQMLRQVVGQEQHQLAQLAEQNRQLKQQLESTTKQYELEFKQALRKIDALKQTISQFEEVEVVTPELVEESDGTEPASPLNGLRGLHDLEAQAQRELEAWQLSQQA